MGNHFIGHLYLTEQAFDMCKKDVLKQKASPRTMGYKPEIVTK